jgi:hypothetical protein
LSIAAVSAAPDLPIGGNAARWTGLRATTYLDVRRRGQSDDEDAPEGWPQAPNSFWFRRHDEFNDPPPSASA